MITYPLAKQGIFLTVQGEGHWLGWPQVFIRLAGCSISCGLCDTDYGVAERLPADDVARRALAVSQSQVGLKTVWITGGEPTDYDLTELLVALRHVGFVIILATAGHKKIQYSTGCHHHTFWHHLSVSPHDPSKWVQREGDELKLCDRVNGFKLADFEPCLVDMGFFGFKYVSPLMDSQGRVDQESLQDCLQWVYRRPDWRLNVQAHKLWQIP